MSSIARDWSVAHHRARRRAMALRRALAYAAVVTFGGTLVLIAAHLVLR